MTAQPKAKMTVDEFLAWVEGRPGRYELVAGEVVAMSPERARHARAKSAVHAALADGIKRAELPCEALPDGMIVRIDAQTVYEPNALVYCGPRLDGDAIEVANPIIVVEVLSPATDRHDTGTKLVGYLGLETVQHYLIVDPVRHVLIHHQRGATAIATRIASEGIVRLEPPGLDFAVADIFAEP
jgi:Uma2 family endonuclease